MSTRSIVAKPDGDSWLGVYVHSDGYPEGVGQDLHNLLYTFGVDKVVETVIDGHPGWSYLDTTGTYSRNGLGERAEFVEDFGLAFTLAQWGGEYEQLTPADLADTWCEYLYIISKNGNILAFEIDGGELTPIDMSLIVG